MEQLPETMAAWPAVLGNTDALAAELSKPAAAKFCGRPMATPEPAVTRGMPAKARPMRIKSSLLMASMTAMPTALALNSAMRAAIAPGPRATTS